MIEAASITESNGGSHTSSNVRQIAPALFPTSGFKSSSRGSSSSNPIGFDLRSFGMVHKYVDTLVSKRTLTKE
jgi:hypothetical protein